MVDPMVGLWLAYGVFTLGLCLVNGGHVVGLWMAYGGLLVAHGGLNVHLWWA